MIFLLQGIRIDWTLNISHILSLLSVLGALWLLWSRVSERQKQMEIILSARFSVIEAWIKIHEKFVDDTRLEFREVKDRIIRLITLAELAEKRFNNIERHRGIE